jgi:hypothetical protein
VEIIGELDSSINNPDDILGVIQEFLEKLHLLAALLNSNPDVLSSPFDLIPTTEANIKSSRSSLNKQLGNDTSNLSLRTDSVASSTMVTFLRQQAHPRFW